MQEVQRFGHFEIRRAQRVLRVDGGAVTVGARAFDLLCVLADHRERVVSKDELLDAVWPGLVVEENNLAVHVAALRRLLGARAIATVPGRGYRLVAPSDDAVDAPAPAAHALPPGPALFGREDDLALLDAALQGARWITLVGAGGVGKTSLALAATQLWRPRLRDGAAWVDLTAVAEPALLPSVVAQTLDVAVAADERAATLAAALAPMQMLLVLDNAEHLLDAATRLVQAVLELAPQVRVLVTSQAALRSDRETVFRLGPLSVPAEGVGAEAALAHGAVALFVAQARAVDRRFALTEAGVDTVVRLCRRLDGLPLAIKLAAARLPLLGLAGLAGRIDDALKLLRSPGTDMPARHRTLLATLDWSHGLLGAAEQVVFRRLGIFSGGFGLDMATAVAGAPPDDDWAVVDAVGELVDRSLVVLDGGTPPRYRLPGVVLDYARRRLEAEAERPAVQQRHAGAVTAHMQRAYAAYWQSADADWLAAHAPEIDNVRAALRWAERDDPGLAIRLAAASGPLFMLLGLAAEARRWFEALAPAAQAAAADVDIARYWLERSRLSWNVSNDAMQQFAATAASIYRGAGDRQGLYLALRCLVAGGGAGCDESTLDEMASLERADWPPRMRSQRMLARFGWLMSTGRVAEARAAGEALWTLSVHEGLASVASAARAGLARAALCAGDPEDALRHAQALIADPLARRGNFVLHALGTAAEALLALGRPGEARRMLADFIAQARDRDLEWFDFYAGVFAWLAACEGRAEAAARLLGYAGQALQRAQAHDRHAEAALDQATRLAGALLDAESLARRMRAGALLERRAMQAVALEE